MKEGARKKLKSEFINHREKYDGMSNGIVNLPRNHDWNIMLYLHINKARYKVLGIIILKRRTLYNRNNLNIFWR